MFIREFVLKIKVAIVYAILKKLSNYSTISYERVSYIKCKSLFEEKQNEREQFELLLQEKTHHMSTSYFIGLTRIRTYLVKYCII